MSSTARQLALDLPHAESFRRDDFLPHPANAAALALVDRWPEWPDRFAAIAGPAGSGKSHLAAIWAERSGARVLDAASLDSAEVVRALATGALVLEDLASNECDEHALFHLLNLAREEEAWLLITAPGGHAFAGFALPDLVSRLRLIPVVALATPDDALMRAVMVKLFADRQLLVEEGTVEFLLARMERSLAAARAIIGRLDRESLAGGRRVTRALASKALESSQNER